METTISSDASVRAAPGWSHDLTAVLNGIYTIWYRDILRFSRDRGRIIASLAQPILFLLFFGSGLSPTVGRLGQGSGDLNYVQFMFPGIIAMAVLFTAVFSAISIVWDREFGFLKEVLVAPIPRWAVVIGKALGGSTTAMAQGALMLVFVPFVGVRMTFLAVVALIPLMFLTAIALSSLGLLLAAQVKSMEGFPVIMNFIMMPMFFLSGALFPLGNLPVWLTVLTRINPVTYGVDAIRQVVLSEAGVPVETLRQLGPSLFGQEPSPYAEAAFVAAFAALMITLAVRAFAVQE